MTVRLGNARLGTRTRLAPRKHPAPNGTYGNVDELKEGRNALGQFLAKKQLQKGTAGKPAKKAKRTKRTKHTKRS